MEERVAQRERELFSCSICRDLLKDPATTSCGHSYCMKCLETHWNAEEEKKIYSCPECKQTFTLKPDLVKNGPLYNLVEELKKYRFQAAPAGPSFAGPGEVACDFCTGKRLKAVKFCTVCVFSYCDKHLQPHKDLPPLRKHKLVEPLKNLQEKICPHHGEVMEMFCRTDQQHICYICSLAQHKGHNTVGESKKERTESRRKLNSCRRKLRQRLRDKKGDLKKLQNKVDTFTCTAASEELDDEEILNGLITFLQERNVEVRRQIRAKQEIEVRRVKALQEKLEEEIAELKIKEAQVLLLKELNQSLPDLDTPSCCTAPPSPCTRDELLQYSQEITLDPNTLNKRLLLCEESRNVTVAEEVQSYPSHPDRFTHERQVLSQESLTDRSYWEVEWKEGVCVAVTYKDILRTGSLFECGFGYNNKSWGLDCIRKRYHFLHNRARTELKAPVSSSRVGVYLDQIAGVLCFYSVADTVTLLQKVHTRFTQPLYAGITFYLPKATTELCKLRCDEVQKEIVS